MSNTTARPVPKPFRYLRIAVYLLASLVGLSLLVVGTVAVIAELKGTWHWAIHLESTISYMGVFVSWLLVALVPLTVALFVGRALYE
ncbi:hypothetical protein BRC67_05655 [Halobacteriales archaeon QH_3_68_24]|nr:MAG: hypothetical protein BRC60_02855 [Halobacteriales archaeon QH_1_68_42]PSP52169.1 MAG: hypothetical protein BRC67_05655 [Halobacteriales archaeon QH_3_68_24]